MPRCLVDVGGGERLLDISSRARRGPERRDRFSPAQIELIARTVHRAPEVMVKVLNRGGQKLLFSMPAGTPPAKVLAAVKAFAREEFSAKHRYAMVLHTDEPHPHVHLVVKAMGRDGKRLNIRRETLRRWRGEFARQLRGQGVAANATDRVIRGETKPQKTDGIHRAGMRDDSRHWRQRAEAVGRELVAADSNPTPGKRDCWRPGARSCADGRRFPTSSSFRARSSSLWPYGDS